MTARRGDIWSILDEFGDPELYGLVISDDHINAGQVPHVIVVSLTSRYLAFEHHIAVGRHPTIGGVWYARCDDPRGVPKSRLAQRVGRVDSKTMEQIATWLTVILALDQ